MLTKLKIILTGATGMVGEGVLLECLASQYVEKVLVVGRRACGYTDPKLAELLVKDLSVPSPAEQLEGYDACFFCAGVSSIGKNEEEYSKLTYDMTLGFANAFAAQNPGKKLSFCYVSGYGTDGTERGKSMWARVKGKTENALLNKFQGSSFMFRPGYMKPVKGQKHVLKFYFGWQLFYPVMKALMPKFTCKLEDVAHAMINCSIHGYKKRVLEVRDIIEAARSGNSQLIS